MMVRPRSADSRTVSPESEVRVKSGAGSPSRNKIASRWSIRGRRELRRLRERYALVKAENDQVFWCVYDCAAGVAALGGRGEKGRLRFALEALRTRPEYAREKELWREIAIREGRLLP